MIDAKDKGEWIKFTKKKEQLLMQRELEKLDKILEVFQD